MVNELWPLIVIYYGVFVLVLIVAPHTAAAPSPCHLWNPLPHLAYWLVMGLMAFLEVD